MLAVLRLHEIGVSSRAPSPGRHLAPVARQGYGAAPACARPGKQHRGGLRVAAYQAERAAPAAKPPPPPASGGGKALVTGSWPCKGGTLVTVLQQSSGGKHHTQVVLSGLPEGSTAELHWGVYRSAPHLWQHPPEAVPEGSRRDERSGAMVTPMQGGDGGSHRLTLSLPASLAPLTLAFVVHVAPPAGAPVVGPTGRPPRPHFVMPLRGRHFSALVGCGGGSSARLGAGLLPAAAPAGGSSAAAAAAAAPAAGAGRKRGKKGEAPAVLEFGGGTQQQQQQQQAAQPQAPQQQGAAVNFAVRCRGAERVCLVLLRPHAAGQQQGQQGGGGQAGEWGMLELVLDPVLNRTGELWHIAVEGLQDLAGLVYGWRLEGDVSWESGCRVQPDLLLLDPWNPCLRYFPASAAADGSPVPLPTLALPDGTAVAVASSLEGLAAEQAAAAAAAAAGGAVAAAAAVAGDGDEFVPGPDYGLEELRLMEVDVRTFAQGAGVQHRGGFLGVAERAGHIRAVGANAVILTPSYATAKGIGLMARAAVHYMAADPLLSSDHGSSLAAAAEFRGMVSALHAAGIEVYLQVDLTFTAEGTDQRPSTLGLRGLDYGAYYRSNGVLNCGSAEAREYILAVLRRWAGEGVDGFCFINAENMVQDREGFILDAPPLAEAICQDPLLKRLKLVALPSDDSLLPRQGVRGFPHWGLWQQRNLGFGRDMLAFMAEDTPGLLTAVAGRLTGSAAIFDADWDPAAALPGNLAIGRRPAFGINSITVLGRQNLAELAAEAAELAAAAGRVEAARGYPGGGAGAGQGPPSASTIAKSLLALSVLALGVPCVPQDAVADLAAAHFVGVLMRLRARLAPLLLPPRFDSPRDIRWHSAVDPRVEPIWDAEALELAVAGGARDTNYIAFSVRGEGGQAVYVGANPYPHAVTAALPMPPAGRVWERVVDTSLPPPDDALLEGGAPLRTLSMAVPAKAVVVLQAAVVESAGLQQAALPR